MTEPDTFRAGENAQLRLKLRGLVRPVITLALVVTAGHLLSWTLAEHYLRPACEQEAARRHWESEGYRLPGPNMARGPRRSYCLFSDAEGSEHVLSANRLVVIGPIFDPWLMSVLVSVLGALLLVRGRRRTPD